MSSKWLTADEVEREYGIRNSSLESWRTYGCAALGGAKPRAMPGEKGPGPRAPNLYLRADLDAIAAVPTSHGRFEDKTGIWIDSNTAWEEFGLRRPVLQTARKEGHRSLDGKKARARKILTVARGGAGEVRRMRIFFYHEDDVARIARGLRQDNTAEVPGQWLTVGQVREQFGYTKHALWHWRVQRCVHLDGQKLAARKAKVLLPTGERLAWVYSLQGLKQIADRLSAAPELTISDAEGSWLSEAAARKAHSISRHWLSFWRRKEWPGLPGKKIRAKRIQTPQNKPNGKAHRRLWVYHADDIARAAAAPDGRTKEGRALKSQWPAEEKQINPEDRRTPEAARVQNRRGRPKGSTDQKARDRWEQIEEDWKNREALGIDSQTKLAEKHGVSRSLVFQVLGNAGLI